MREPGDGVAPLADRPLSQPAASRLAPGGDNYAEIIRAHSDAMAAERPGYLDPGTGLFVMTARYHADRGWCCHSGCRHCPYTPQ